MRSILLDELSSEDMGKLSAFLSEVAIPSGLPDVFWLRLPDDLLTKEQLEHDACKPHRVAFVLEPDSLRVELLVRSKDSLRCSCTGFATGQQRNYLLKFVDRMIDELKLTT